METKYLYVLLILVLTSACQTGKLPVVVTGAATPMPSEWIDKDTGHKTIHLVPGGNENRSFYFHNNPFLQAVGDINEKMVFYRKVSDDMQLFSVDLKTRGKTFFLSGTDLASGNENLYAMTRNEWFIHFAVSPDQKIFAGDGGDSGQVAKADDRQNMAIFVKPQRQ